MKYLCDIKVLNLIFKLNYYENLKKKLIPKNDLLINSKLNVTK